MKSSLRNCNPVIFLFFCLIFLLQSASCLAQGPCTYTGCECNVCKYNAWSGTTSCEKERGGESDDVSGPVKNGQLPGQACNDMCRKAPMNARCGGGCTGYLTTCSKYCADGQIPDGNGGCTSSPGLKGKFR